MGQALLLHSVCDAVFRERPSCISFKGELGMFPNSVWCLFIQKQTLIKHGDPWLDNSFTRSSLSLQRVGVTAKTLDLLTGQGRRGTWLSAPPTSGFTLLICSQVSSCVEKGLKNYGHVVTLCRRCGSCLGTDSRAAVQSCLVHTGSRASWPWLKSTCQNLTSPPTPKPRVIC